MKTKTDYRVNIGGKRAREAPNGKDWKPQETTNIRGKRPSPGAANEMESPSTQVSPKGTSQGGTEEQTRQPS